MKRILPLLTLLCVSFLALPAAAGNVYDNGPVNGQVDAFTINFGFAVSDSFTVSNGNGQISGMDFFAWVFPGDVLTSVDVQIGLEAFGNELFDATVALSQSNCFANGFGFDVCMASGTFPTVSLGNGTYWVTLQNASVPSGDPVFWDQNSGVGCQSPGCPSQAQNLGVGSIPSETFTLTGGTTTGTTPEPSSLLLLASGGLSLVGILRRKFF